MSEGGRDEARLRRELGLVLATAVTVNAMVGTGIFRLAPKVLSLAGSSAGALAMWGAGAVISLCGALSIAELAAAMPRAGGIYEYLRRAYGPALAFWFGWTRLWLLGPSAAGSFARLAAESLGAAVGFAPSPARDTWLAISILGVCTLLNVGTVRSASIEQALLSALKLAGLFVLGAACAVAVGGTEALSSLEAPHPSPVQAWASLGALVSVMWTYDGWSDVATLAGETREPARTLPKALVLGTLLVSIAYALVNVGYLHVLGEQGVLGSTSGANMVAMRAAAEVLGPLGTRVLAALVFTSCLGACMVGMLTGSRVFVSMASDGLFSRWLGAVSPRTGAPARAVVVTSLLACAYLSVRSFEQLTDGFVAGMFPFYLLAVIALFVLRVRAPELARPFRTPLYPWVPCIFILGACAVLRGALTELSGASLVALFVMLSGLPIGIVVARRARKMEAETVRRAA